MRRASLLLALAGITHAAVITSNGTGGGNWNSVSTWNGGGVPGAGDTVVIANGDTVTVPAATSVTVGASPASDTSTPAIACSSATGTGILVVNGSLTFRGTVTQCNSAWNVGAGASLIHDSSLATTPSATHYTWKIGMANLQVGSKLVVTGTAANRAILTIAAGSGNAGGFVGTTTTTTDSGQVQLTWADVDHWGISTGYFIRAFPTSSGFDIHLDHCRINNSGPISIARVASNTIERILGTSITAPLFPASNRYIEIGYQALLTAVPTGADLRIQDSYIEGEVAMTVNSSYVGGNTGWKYLNTVFAGGTSSAQPPLLFSNAPRFADGDFDLVFIYNRISSSSDTGQLPSGNLTRILNYRNYTINPHYSTFPNFAAPGHTVSATVSGSISESLYDVNAAGDTFMSNISAGAASYSITGSISLPTPGGQAIGTFVNHNATGICNGITVVCPVWTVERNTIVGDNFGDHGASASGVSGESNSGYAGFYSSVRNNILGNHRAITAG